MGGPAFDQLLGQEFELNGFVDFSFGVRDTKDSLALSMGCPMMGTETKMPGSRVWKFGGPTSCKRIVARKDQVRRVAWVKNVKLACIDTTKEKLMPG